jgi:hypothetical protein
MLVAPAFAREITGIATDFHTVTSKFAGPKSKKQKIWEGVKLGAVGARFIP